jgi:SAM-dependent methyltransferase
VADPTPFYDDLAEHYHLVYEDWGEAMARQGRALQAIFARIFPRWSPGQSLRILDAAAGIGTQTLPLAEAGHHVVARDLSAAAIERLRREASLRELEIDAAVGDMRTLDESLEPGFDVVLAFDNAVPHLVDDDDMVGAFAAWARLLRAGGSVVISIRDYDAVERGVDGEHPYGERVVDGHRYRLGQRWRWQDDEIYDTTLTVEEEVDGEWVCRVETTARYRAVSLRRLSELMRAGGLLPRRMDGVEFYQPVLAGRVA